METASPFPTAATPTPEAAKPAKTRAPAAVLEFVTPSGDKLKAIKYPMPLKAPRYDMSVNGETVSAAQTTFGAILYTYFQYKGASFYVPGHHKEGEFKFIYPEGYKFEPLKLDRAAQSAKAAKSKAEKTAAAPASDTGAEGSTTAASGDAGAESGGPTSDPSPASEPAAAPAEETKPSRKAKR